MRSDQRSFSIGLHGVEHILFFSNHVQNVVDRIYRFSCWQEAMAVEEFSEFAESFLSPHFVSLEESPTLYVRPITGGDLFAQYSALDIF